MGWPHLDSQGASDYPTPSPVAVWDPFCTVVAGSLALLLRGCRAIFTGFGATNAFWALADVSSRTWPSLLLISVWDAAVNIARSGLQPNVGYPLMSGSGWPLRSKEQARTHRMQCTVIWGAQHSSGAARVGMPSSSSSKFSGRRTHFAQQQQRQARVFAAGTATASCICSSNSRGRCTHLQQLR